MQLTNILLLAGFAAAAPLASSPTVEPTPPSGSVTATPTPSPSPTGIVGPPIERTENFTMTVTSASNKTLDGLTVVIPDSTATSVGLQLSDKPVGAALGAISGTADEFKNNNATLDLWRNGLAPTYEGVIPATDLSPFVAQTAASLNRDNGGFGVDPDSMILYHLAPGSGDFYACSSYDGATINLRWGPAGTEGCDKVEINVHYQAPQ